jgi:hypothetical protein
MKSRRRKQVVYGGLQYQLAFRLILHWLMFAIALASLFPLLRILTVAPTLATFSETMSDFGVYATTLGLALVCLLPYFVWDSLKMSNRFAGPMFRMQRVIQALSRGERVTPLAFRDGDFWQDVAADFNGMLRRLGALDGQGAEPAAEQLDGDVDAAKMTNDEAKHE